MAGRGKARRGVDWQARRGVERPGMARGAWLARHGMAGVAGLGKDGRQGLARRGAEWPGEAWIGRRGETGRGKAWRGMDWQVFRNIGAVKTWRVNREYRAYKRSS